MQMNRLPLWEEVKKSFSYAAKKFGLDLPKSIRSDQLFDEFHMMKGFCKEQIPKWFQQKSSPQQVWIEVFKHFRDENVQITNMERLVEFAFSLAGTSCKVERMFPLLNRIWSPEKGNLHIKTVNALLSVQNNLTLDCPAFYNFIKSDNNILQKIISSSKYT
jgi:hypothetical protein